MGWLGIALHLAISWLYLVAGLVTPFYGLLLLWGLWTALMLLAFRLLRSRPLWTPLVPVVALGLWWGVLSVGGLFLGWTP